MGVLAVARSFGDFVLKAYVTAEPYTSTTKLDSSVGEKGGDCGANRTPPATLTPPTHTPPPLPQSSFIILACDGVWDVMEDQEAVDLVREHVGNGDHARIKTAGQALVDVSIARGSSDNVSALVVFLD